MSIIIKPDFSLEKSLRNSRRCRSCGGVHRRDNRLRSYDQMGERCIRRRQKVCGILTEGITDLETGQIEYLVIGIGINTTVKDFPDELKATAGAVEGNYSKSALAADIITKTLDFTAEIDKSSFMDIYRKKSLVTGKDVTVYKGRYKIDPKDEIPGRRAMRS